MKSIILAGVLGLSGLGQAMTMAVPAREAGKGTETTPYAPTFSVQCSAGTDDAPGNQFFALGTGVDVADARKAAETKALKDCKATVNTENCVIISCTEL